MPTSRSLPLFDPERFRSGPSAGGVGSPTDHLTHYANYLDDADGNGLEMVFETPERLGSMLTGPGAFGFIDAEGRSHSGREAIDLR